jgi:hypothetical protein
MVLSEQHFSKMEVNRTTAVDPWETYAPSTYPLPLVLMIPDLTAGCGKSTLLYVVV